MKQFIKHYDKELKCFYFVKGDNMSMEKENFVEKEYIFRLNADQCDQVRKCIDRSREHEIREHDKLKDIFWVHLAK